MYTQTVKGGSVGCVQTKCVFMHAAWLHMPFGGCVYPKCLTVPRVQTCLVWVAHVAIKPLTLACLVQCFNHWAIQDCNIIWKQHGVLVDYIDRFILDWGIDCLFMNAYMALVVDLRLLMRIVRVSQPSSVRTPTWLAGTMRVPPSSSSTPTWPPCRGVPARNDSSTWHCRPASTTMSARTSEPTAWAPSQYLLT